MLRKDGQTHGRTVALLYPLCNFVGEGITMYKDKESKKNVKNISFINVWRKSVFDIYFTEYGTALNKG
jgi:hypothetical protein